MSDFTRRSLLAGAIGAAITPAPAFADQPALPAAASLPKFKLGLVTYNVAAEWDLPTVLSVCTTVGISVVELRTGHKHGVEPSLSKDQRAEVRKRFADSGITFWGCGSTCEFQSPDPAVVRKNIETCKQFVELVKDIGGHGVKVRPNGLPKGVADPQKTLEQIGGALVECGRMRGRSWTTAIIRRSVSRGIPTRRMSKTAPSPKLGSCLARACGPVTSTTCIRTRRAFIRIVSCSA